MIRTLRHDAPAPLLAAIFADAVWQARLAGEREWSRFAACLSEGAARPGLVADAQQPVVTGELPPAGWLPVRVTGTTQADARIEWLHMGDGPLTEPFFDDRVRQMRARPFNRWLRVETPLAVLDHFADAPGPDGLICHQSRCGST